MLTVDGDAPLRISQQDFRRKADDEHSNDSLNNSSHRVYSTLKCTQGVQQIRVLDLAAADAATDMRIQGKLRVVNLVDNPRFSALSYVWGQPGTSDQFIYCGEHVIRITANCYSALRYLRQMFGAITIWIDAICINQVDKEEKAIQIPLMSLIYSRAERVLVWLGDGNDASDEAMDFFQNAGFQRVLSNDGELMYKTPKRKQLWQAIWLAYSRRIWSRLSFSRGRAPLYDGTLVDKPISGEKLSASLMDLLGREWPERIWTLQEILLASNILICCGTKRLSWRSLIYTFAFLGSPNDLFGAWHRIVTLWLSIPEELNSDYKQQKSAIQQSLRTYHDFLENVRAKNNCLLALTPIFVALCFSGGFIVIQVRFPSSQTYLLFAHFLVESYIVLKFLMWIVRNERPPNPWLPVTYSLEATGAQQSLIQEIRTRKCKDPRDKSYGTQSALARFGVHLAAPNYTKKLSEVNRDLFVGLLEWRKSLSLLQLAAGPDLADQPSWVPDWQVDPVRTQVEWNWFGKSTAATGSSQGYYYLRSPRELVVHGKFIGQVDWVCAKFTETSKAYCDEERASHLSNITAISDTLVYLSRIFPTVLWWQIEKSDQGISVSHHFSYPHYSRPGPAMSGRAGLAATSYYLSNRNHIDRHGRELHARRLYSKYIKDPEEALEDLKEDPNLWETHTNICNGLAIPHRTLFATPYVHGLNHGIEIGDCSNHVQIGDVLALVSGVSMPLVLRPSTSSYRLVGGAQISSLMKGQGWKDFKREDLDVIVLI